LLLLRGNVDVLETNPVAQVGKRKGKKGKGKGKAECRDCSRTGVWMSFEKRHCKRAYLKLELDTKPHIFTLQPGSWSSSFPSPSYVGCSHPVVSVTR